MVILNRPHQQEIGDSWRGGVLFFLAYRFKRKLFITNVEAVVENSGAVLTRHVYGGLNMKKMEIGVLFFAGIQYHRGYTERSF